MKDPIKFISKNIPPVLEYEGNKYEFKIIINNNAPNDIKFIYICTSVKNIQTAESFLFLHENIFNNEQFIEALKELKKEINLLKK